MEVTSLCRKLGDSSAHPDWAGVSWYRFSGAAGTHMAQSQPAYFLCGTSAVGYLVGDHTLVSDGEFIRTVVFDNNGNPDFPMNIFVTNCRFLFVYYLKDSPIQRGFCGV